MEKFLQAGLDCWHQLDRVQQITLSAQADGATSYRLEGLGRTGPAPLFTSITAKPPLTPERQQGLARWMARGKQGLVSLQGPAPDIKPDERFQQADFMSIERYEYPCCIQSRESHPIAVYFGRRRDGWIAPAAN